MDPRILLFTGGQPYIEAAGLIITEDGAWTLQSFIQGELVGHVSASASVTGNLHQYQNLSGASSGAGSIGGQIVIDAEAGFEIPYLVGLGGTTTVSLVTIVAGTGLITGNLSQINQLSSTIAGASTITGAFAVTGSQVLSGASAGVGSLIGELYVNATRNLAGSSAGSSTVIVTITNLTGEDIIDSGSITHMYLFTNVGVGFDPTDTYTGPGNITAQTFPDGHTRDDFWEYLYLFINVGVGFDPTDDASDRDDFVSQTFPDGHTAYDFHEYLYLYLNVVRGRIPHGQLIIRPGFTQGPTLPGAKPPKLIPQ